ncbi:hypothetical protein [Rhizobium sp.]|uniref:hypothetical protein n=1 Tax=Rhizobium sp. TaxID=391 RepID=UPI002896508E
MVPLYRIEARRFGKNLQRIGHGFEIGAPMYVFTLVSAHIVPDAMRLKAWGFVDSVRGNPRLLAQLDRKITIIRADILWVIWMTIHTVKTSCEIVDAIREMIFVPYGAGSRS